jgi:CHAT domain-containing protein
VAALWPKAQLYLGPAADEAMLKSVHQPRLLHVATHGFFLQPTGAPAAPFIRGVLLDSGPVARRDPTPVENALLLSGIALAGANKRPERDADDGLLFALELSSLDLRGTQLVVLSACQTGLGASVAGEGLYGLRRALVLAGSQTQILSLWSVQDDATARFMDALHRSLAKGAARSDALRDTQRAFLGQPGTADPFFWAAFFVQGDPSSFDGRPPVPLAGGASPVQRPGRGDGHRRARALPRHLTWLLSS